MLDANKETLIELNKALNCAAALIIYRASPKQKQQVVQFIRTHNPGKVTLSIGDGSNDVNMIQTAHVGIGLLGKEGNQAASFSDYSLPDFRSLRKLVLWHGRQFGQGSGDFLCTCIFKNIAFSTSLSTYNFFAGFSGLQPIDTVFWLWYAVCITTVQMGMTFILDQDVSMMHAAKVVNRSQTLDEYEAKKTGNPIPPEDKSKDIYEEEERKIQFNLSDYYLFSKMKYQLPLIQRTLLWELHGIFCGIICFVIAFKIYGYGVANGSGKTEDLFGVYFAAYQANVFIHHMQMFVTIRNYTKFFLITSIISLSMLWPFCSLLCNYSIFLPSENLYDRIGEIVFDQFIYQASTLIISTAIVVSPIYFFKIIKMRMLYPQYFPVNQSTLNGNE